MSYLKPLLDKPAFYNFVQLLLGMDFYQAARRYITMYPHESILEIGCGTGDFVKNIKPRKYLGIDINKSYIAFSRRKYGSKDILFTEMDATKIPKLKEMYDQVVIINVIHHLSDRKIEGILKNLIRNVSFKRLILFDSKPDFGIMSSLLERADQGSHFRELDQIESIFKKYLVIEESFVLKRPYWVYKFPTLVGKKR